MDWQRRRLLQLAGISGIGVLAGCNDSGNSDTESPSRTDGFTPGSNTPRLSQVKLAASDGKASDRFGISVAISGDTALIGAISYNHGSGSAYVFVYSDGTWTQQAKLTPNDDSGNIFFGNSVAISGDTALIGDDWYTTSNSLEVGAAYVFTRSGNSWSQQAKLTASDGDEGDNFGHSIAIAGDTALIGANTDEDPNGGWGGSAYVFTRSGDSWTQQAKLSPRNGGEDAGFGSSVALSGDTALIGARNGTRSGGEWAGTAYVFTRSSGSWSQQAKLTPTEDGETISGEFGDSVALAGDTALIGDKMRDKPDWQNAGAAYVFTRSDGSWSQQAKLTANRGDGDDKLGSSIALAGDTALIGSEGDEEPDWDNAGSAYVFTRSDGAWSQQAKLTAYDSDEGDYFGNAVALAADTALVGAERDNDPNGENGGSAYIFDIK